MIDYKYVKTKSIDPKTQMLLHNRFSLDRFKNFINKLKVQIWCQRLQEVSKKSYGWNSVLESSCDTAELKYYSVENKISFLKIRRIYILKALYNKYLYNVIYFNNVWRYCSSFVTYTKSVEK